MESSNGGATPGNKLSGASESDKTVQSSTATGLEVRPDQAAYDEMTDAVKIIVHQIKQFPHLMTELAQEVEIAMIKIVMDRCEGNCTQAAKLLGINRTTLIEKRKRYKMELKTIGER